MPARTRTIAVFSMPTFIAMASAVLKPMPRISRASRYGFSQGNLLNGPNGLNGRGYFDSRGFLIRGGRGIAVENDFAAGSGPARQARARLHAVVDPEPDRRIALVWAARNEGGLFSWAEPEPASKGGTRLYTRDDTLSCDADRNLARHRRASSGRCSGSPVSRGRRERASHRHRRQDDAGKQRQ